MRRPQGSTKVERRSLGRRGGQGERARGEQERFADRARRARSIRWRPLLAVLAALAIIGGIVYLVWFSPVLVVRSVEVEGVSGAAADQVRSAAAVPLGQHLVNVDLDAPGRRVTHSPLYADATVSRKWPTTVVVHVTPRTPVLALSQNGGAQLVDDQGVAYLAVPQAPKGVPTVSGTGQVTPQGLRAAISVMQSLPQDLRGRVSAMTVTSPSMVTFQLGQVKVLWGDETQPELKVKVLQALLRTARTSINVSAPDSPSTT